MSATANFVRQHEELFALGSELAPRLTVERVAAEAPEIRRALARFAGKLRVHARMENEALYPRLLVHGDPEVRRRAQALFDELGPIYAGFDAYLARWPTAEALRADPATFVRETFGVLKQLGRRMWRENLELYPLADAAGAAPAA
ncbi:MAG TPA: hemerythrin domain-containing protein [Minicystis sp.]|nr:hemerythrin domain-containing protein [Minicystis sp.]